MYQYTKKTFLYILFIINFLCFVSPSGAMDEEDKQFNGKQGGSRGFYAQILSNFDPCRSPIVSSCVRKFYELNERGCELERTGTYQMLSAAWGLTALWYKPEDAFVVCARRIPSFFMPFIHPFLSKSKANFLENSFNWCFDLAILSQYPKQYIGEKIMGYAALLAMSFTSEEKIQYNDQIEATLYFLFKRAGWNESEKFQNDVNSIGQMFFNAPSEKEPVDALQLINREGFFVGAATVPKPEYCPVPGRNVISKCKNLPLTCSQLSNIIGTREKNMFLKDKEATQEVCEFFRPDLLQKWSTVLCPNIVENIRKSKKAGIPSLFLFGETHNYPWPRFFLLPLAVNFAIKNGKSPRLLLEGSLDGIIFNGPPKNMGIPSIYIDIYYDTIPLGEYGNPKLVDHGNHICPQVGEKREKGMFEKIEQTYDPDTQTVSFGLVGQDHVSALIANDFIQEHFITQAYLLGQGSYYSADADCPSEIRQRINLLKEINPTVPQLALKIVKIPPGKEEKLLLFLAQEKIGMLSLTRPVAEALMSYFYSDEVINLAQKKFWYKNLIEIVLRKHPKIKVGSKEALMQAVEKQGGWYITLFTLLECHKRTTEEGKKNERLNVRAYFMDLLKKTESDGTMFFNSLHEIQQNEIFNILLGKIVFEDKGVGASTGY